MALRELFQASDVRLDDAQLFVLSFRWSREQPKPARIEYNTAVSSVEKLYPNHFIRDKMHLKV